MDNPKFPLDGFPYRRHIKSVELSLELVDGCYVYVKDTIGSILVLPDGPHQHPLVLGGGLPALYAGDVTIANRKVKDLTNLSGTFQFGGKRGAVLST